VLAQRAEAQADNNVNGFPKLSEAKPPFRSKASVRRQSHEKKQVVQAKDR